MFILSTIKSNRKEFLAICQSHQVENLFAFGSSVSDRFNPEISDVDLIVKIGIDNPIDRGEALLSFWDELENFFDRKVDLLTEDSIKNPYLKKSIEATKKLIYDRQREKIFV
jgi:hypothetical protein